MHKLLLIALLAASVSACKDEPDPQQVQYCAMVERWHADAAAGIPPKNRTGWPPYQGECK